MHKQNFLVLLSPLVFLIIVLLILEILIYASTGHIIYPIDDPYIHMAMARHFVQDGIFGVSLSGFSASSSAPGWTIMLSLFYAILGVHNWIPFVLNSIAACSLLIVLIQYLYTRIEHSLITAIITTLCIFIIPLPALVTLGMEHTFHCFLVSLLIIRSLWIINEEHWHDWDGWLMILTVLSITFRYESIFLISMLTLVFLLRGAIKPAIILVLSSIAIVCIIGLIQSQLGWMFLPNSILQKSILFNDNTNLIQQSISRLFGQLFNTGHLFFPFIFSCAGLLYSFKDRDYFNSDKSILCFVLIGTSLLHCSFAAIGWFYRYESYLVVIAILTFFAWFRDYASTIQSIWFNSGKLQERMLSKIAVGGAIAIFLIIYSINLGSIFKVVPGAQNLFEQQYQMGLFLEQHYQGDVIVANDIGAINYLADIYCLDLMGLASIEPIQANQLNRYNQSFISNWATNRNAKIAIIYEAWFRDQIPETWIKMAEWYTPNKHTVASQTVAFYAIQPEATYQLRENLLDYQDKLPQAVEATVAKQIVSPDID